MRALKKLFLRMKEREQKLLVFACLVVLCLALFKIVEEALLKYDDWSGLILQSEAHQTIIRLKPGIDKALEAQKVEQENKSYDKKSLSNRASILADKVFPARDYRELDTDERERYSQHRVKITFKRASYESVNEYASLIRAESPSMFLSEVKITPQYPPKSRPYEPTTFDAEFEVSSVEFIKQ